MADLELTVDTSEVKGASKSLDELGKAAQRLVRIRERSATKEEAFTRKNLRLVQDRINMGKRLERQQQAEANAAENIRRKYVPLYAASKDYERAIEELNQAYAQGILTQGQYIAAMNNIDRQLGSFQKQGVGSKRVMNDFGMATQQVGYQVGDFLVQVQSGTNAFVAFGQQATQLVGILPLFADSLGVSAGRLVAISAGLGIVIPLVTALAAAFMRTRDSAEDASSSVSSLESRINSLKEELIRYGRVKEAISLGLTPEEFDITTQIKEAEQKLRDLRANQEQVIGSIASSSGFGFNVSEETLQYLIENNVRVKEAVNDVTEAERILGELRDKLADEQRQNFSAERREYEQRIQLANQVRKYGEESAQAEATRFNQTLDNLRVELALRVQQGELTKTQADNLFEVAKAAMEAEKQADKVNETVSIIAGLDMPFTEKVKQLAEQLGVAAGAARTLLMNLGELPPVQGPGLDTLIFTKPDPNIGPFQPDSPYGPRGSKSGGGGGGAAQESALARLQKQVDLERRLLEVSDAKARVIRALGDDYDKYNATMGDSIQTLIENIEKTEELKNKQAEIQGIADTIQSSMSDAFMSMVDGTKSASDAFKDMARAIIKELYDVLVVQQLVGSFDAKSGEGRGIAGFLGKALSGALATGGTMQPGGAYLVGERGPEIVMPGTRSTVMNDNLSSKAMGGGQVVDVRVFVDDNGNFDAKVDRISQRNISRAAPAIIEQSVGATVSRVKRGGSTKDAFR